MGRERRAGEGMGDYDDNPVTKDLFIKPRVLVNAIYSEFEPDTSDEGAEVTISTVHLETY